MKIDNKTHAVSLAPHLLWVIVVLILSINPVIAESGVISISVRDGWAWSITGKAIDWVPDEAELKRDMVYGGSIMYRFPSRIALELSIDRFGMDLEASGNKHGTLNMMPIMLLLKIQGMPEDDTGLTAHIETGGGVSINNFNKGTSLIETEKENPGVQFTIDTDNSLLFEIGGGFDYFFTRKLSFSLDGRFLLGSAHTLWKVSGPIPSGPLATIALAADKFYTSNFQVLLGARYWFR